MAGVSAREWSGEVLLRGCFPALVAVLVWGGLEVLSPPTTWLRLGLYVVVGAGVYVAVLILRCLDTYDRNQLRRVTEELRGRLRALSGKRAPVSVASNDVSGN